jgi:superkiller protein 3
LGQKNEDEFIKTGKYDEAIELYKKAIDLYSANQEARLGMANAYSKKGNNQEAIIILKSSIESEPQNKKAYYELGKIYRVENRKEDSTESFKKACELGLIKACEEKPEKKKKKK